MSAATLGPSPGSARNPEHTLEIQPAGGTWSARLDGTLLARSSDALLLDEAGYEPVVYFPPSDVATDALKPSETRTHCPFKGEAHYYSAAGSAEATDVAWYYPAVFDEVAAIADYVAFYPSRVELTLEQ